MATPLPPRNDGKTYKKKKVDDIRPQVFKANYINPSSDTFMNVLQSALRAGYSQEYSESLGYQNPKWFAELMEDSAVRRAKMLFSAEKAIEKVIDYDDSDKDRATLKLKAATFVTERLGREHYSTRQEVTGADGRSVFANNERENAKKPLETLFKGISPA